MGFHNGFELPPSFKVLASEVSNCESDQTKEHFCCLLLFVCCCFFFLKIWVFIGIYGYFWVELLGLMGFSTLVNFEIF
jgi:hypothetical protein